MPPRTGIGGVTLQNVANVGRYGSQAMPSNTTPSATSQADSRLRSFTRPLSVTNPAASTARMTVSPEDLDRLLFGDVLPTAGEKYAGYSTQAQYENAIAGRAYQILEQADLARRLAESNQAKIADRYASETAAHQAAYDKMLQESTAGLPAAELGASGRAIGEAPPVVPGQNKVQMAERALSALTTEVDPYQQVADQILAYSPSELAQQIATRQFGMTPELAASQFGPDFTSGYYKDLVDLDASRRAYENMQAGFYSETLEETLFRLYGQDGIDQYRMNRADEALNLDPASQAKEEERQLSGENDAIDQELAPLYMGMTPETITTDVDKALVRKTMQDEQFYNQFVQLAEMFAPEGEKYQSYALPAERRAAINETALAIYGPTVTATILADLVYNWSLTGG